jgi:hypothetical protein
MPKPKVVILKVFLEMLWFLIWLLASPSPLSEGEALNIYIKSFMSKDVSDVYLLKFSKRPQ